MKGHPVAAAVIAFIAVPSIAMLVLNKINKPEIGEDQKKKDMENMGAASAIGIAATIAAYYSFK